jgi:hypothetical protein
MLNDYAFGGYLIWAAPEHPVFVDAHADVFEWTAILGDFGSWATLKATPIYCLPSIRLISAYWPVSLRWRELCLYYMAGKPSM